jgi:exopolysaccharide biosynthesis polyprenyl glycosylphosphotransferase
VSAVDESIDRAILPEEPGADVIALPFVRKPRLVPRRRAVVLELGHLVALTLALAPLVAASGSQVGWQAVGVGAAFAVLVQAAAKTAARFVPSALGSLAAALTGAAVGFVVLSAVTAWLPVLTLGAATMLLMGVSIAGLAVVREIAAPAVDVRETKVLVVGGGPSAEQLIEDVRARPDRGFRVVAIVTEEPPAVSEVDRFDLTEIPAAVDRHEPDLIVVAVERGRIGVFRTLLDLAGSEFRIVGVPEFYEHAFGRVPVSHLTPAWFMSLLHLYQRPYTRFTKRMFDVVVAAVALVLTAPLFLLAFLAVGRAPIYRQVRLGEGGQPFTMLKFRTMRQDAEEPGSAVFATVDDPRITRSGRILRRTRLDELPQLWNVLVGQMSIVGPRPERPEFYAMLAKQVPFWTRRHVVKPGITGWAQVNSGYADDAVSTTEKLSFDLWYLRHRSFLTDLVICARTLPKFVSPENGAR